MLGLIPSASLRHGRPCDNGVSILCEIKAVVARKAVNLYVAIVERHENGFSFFRENSITLGLSFLLNHAHQVPNDWFFLSFHFLPFGDKKTPQPLEIAEVLVLGLRRKTPRRQMYFDNVLGEYSKPHRVGRAVGFKDEQWS